MITSAINYLTYLPGKQPFAQSFFADFQMGSYIIQVEAGHMRQVFLFKMATDGILNGSFKVLYGIAGSKIK